MASSSDNFRKMFYPEHPQRRLHILVSILAFVAIAGSMTLYQIRKVEKPEQAVVDKKQQPGYSDAEKREKVSRNLADVAAKSPPLTEAQRIQILNNLSKSISK